MSAAYPKYWKAKYAVAAMASKPKSATKTASKLPMCFTFASPSSNDARNQTVCAGLLSASS